MTDPVNDTASGGVARLAAMSREQVRSFFRSSDVAEVTAAVRGAGDDDLRRLVDDDTVREEGVAAILDRFAELADPDRLARIDGVVRFDLARGRSRPERHTARFAGGVVTMEPDATPEVTIAADVVDFVRLVTGEADAALLYLADRLRITGRELLALDVGSVFVVPGSDRAAVDPTSLDPVDVATAVAGTSAAHQRAVMGGEFRPVVLGEVFRRFPEFLDPRRAARVRLSVGFKIGGRADGGSDRYCVHVADGVCRVETDPPEDQRRDATIVLDGVDFLRLVTGQLHPVRSVLSGALRIRGDKAKALALSSVVVPPKPRAERPGG